MKLWKLGAYALASLLCVVGTSASATMPGRVQRFGHVFARNNCGNSVARGQARCFSKVVTDAHGNILERLTPAVRNATPPATAPVTCAVPTRSRPPVAPATRSRSSMRSAIPTRQPIWRSIALNMGFRPAPLRTAASRRSTRPAEQTTIRGRTWVGPGVRARPRHGQRDVPELHILLVEASNDYLDNLAARGQKAVAPGANAVSNSYGGSEGGTSSYEPAYNHPGVAITVSSGDYGYGVQFPASSPHVTAVGGTSLVRPRIARGWSETVWNGAGSGCSTVYGKPSWQHRRAVLAPNGCRRIGGRRSEHRRCGLRSGDVSPFGLDGVRWNQRCCSPDRRRLRRPRRDRQLRWRSVRPAPALSRRDQSAATAAAAAPIFAPAERAMTARPGSERRTAPPPSKRCDFVNHCAGVKAPALSCLGHVNFRPRDRMLMGPGKISSSAQRMRGWMHAALGVADPVPVSGLRILRRSGFSRCPRPRF